LCASLKGNVRGIVLAVMRMIKLKCAVPENTNTDVLRRKVQNVLAFVRRAVEKLSTLQYLENYAPTQ
jgi:hypothetical protein